MQRRNSTGGRAPRRCLGFRDAEKWTAQELASKLVLIPRLTTFPDHRGETCFSTYTDMLMPSLNNRTPTPPWSYQVYVTVKIETEAYQSFCEKFWRNVASFNHPEVIPIRLDFTFLQGSSNVECMQHYQQELASERQNGDYAIVEAYDKSYKQAENILIIVNQEDYEEQGVLWIHWNNQSMAASNYEWYNDNKEWQVHFENYYDADSLSRQVYDFWDLGHNREEVEEAYRIDWQQRDEAERDMMMILRLEQQRTTAANSYQQ